MFNLLKKRGFSKGLTLVETLIYTVIVGITGGLLVGILTTSTRIQTQTSTGTEVSTELNFAVETIQRLVKESSVIIVNSDGNTDNDSTPLGEPYAYLILRMKDSAGGTTDRDPIVIWRDAETQSIKVRQGKSPNQTTNEITTSKVLADNLVFRKVVGYPGHDTVQIEMTLSYNTQVPGGAVSRTLRSSVGRVSAATFDSVLLPGTTNTYDIGTSGTMWKDLYLQNGYIDNKLGIGTTSPSEKLQVTGGNISQTPSTPIRKTGTLPGGNDIYISGRYTYIVMDNNTGTCSGTTLTGCEFKIYDSSNPASPAPLGGADFGGGRGLAVYVSARYAYVIKNNSGITNDFLIYDVSNPYAPSAVGGVDFAGQGMDVYVSGRYAYVVKENVGATNDFLIYDISNPASPVAVGGIDLGTDGRGIYVSGRYAYVANAAISGTCSGTDLTGCEFRIYDISNPASPTAVGGIDTGVNTLKSYISGRYAYITTLTASGTCSGTDLTGCEFRIYDISNPASPTAVGGIDTGAWTYNVYVSGRYAYISIYTISGTCSGTDLTGCEFRIYDISNPASPTPIGGYDTSGGSVQKAYISGNYAYVVGGNWYIFDISGAEITSATIHSLETGNLQVRNDVIARGQLQVSGGVNVGSGGIFSAGPLGIAATSTPSYFGGNVGIGTTSPTSKLHITDGSLTQDTPTNPTIVGGSALSLPGYADAIYVSGRYAYVVFTNSGTDAFRIIDVSNPDSPTVVGGSALSLPSNARSIYVSGRYAYVGFSNAAGTDIFRIIDVSNPASPTVVGGSALSLPGGAGYADSIYVSGQYAYLISNTAAGTNILRIIDVSNPASPTVVGGSALSLPGYPYGIHALNRYAYMAFPNAAGTDIFRVIDVSGIEAVSAMVNSLEAGNLQVRNDLIAQGQLQVAGGVNIGTNANITGNLAAANVNRLIQVQEQQPSGTAAGTGVASAWTTRVLNTVVTNTIPGASLASNQVTLPAGSYHIEARSPAMCGAVYHRISLYNVTDASYVIYGQNAQSSSNTYFTDCTPDFLTGNFTITSAKTFEIRYYKTGNYSNALGQATSFGVIEIYEDVTIWKTS